MDRVPRAHRRLQATTNSRQSAQGLERTDSGRNSRVTAGKYFASSKEVTALPTIFWTSWSATGLLSTAGTYPMRPTSSDDDCSVHGFFKTSAWKLRYARKSARQPHRSFTRHCGHGSCSLTCLKILQRQGQEKAMHRNATLISSTELSQASLQTFTQSTDLAHRFEASSHQSASFELGKRCARGDVKGHCDRKPSSLTCGSRAPANDVQVWKSLPSFVQ